MMQAYSAPLFLMNNMNYENIKQFLSKSGIEYSEEKSLSEMTTFKTGGKAAIVAYPENENAVSLLLKEINEKSIPFYILGRGSNVLALDEGFGGVIISSEKLDYIRLENETEIHCGAGISMMRICRFALENSLTGLEFAYGIPGSAGGGAYMNAGAYGGEMKDVLVSCTDVSLDGKIAERKSENLALGYRKSFYSDKDYFITGLVLKLQKGNKDEIKAKMDDLMSRRKDKQPLEYPSAGSTFKRPEGYFAGALIEECGLKGFTFGGAAVSEKHAGFVINKGGATSADVLSVIDYCKKTVLENKGVSLEPEVKILK